VVEGSPSETVLPHYGVWGRSRVQDAAHYKMEEENGKEKLSRSRCIASLPSLTCYRGDALLQYSVQHVHRNNRRSQSGACNVSDTQTQFRTCLTTFTSTCARGGVADLGGSPRKPGKALLRIPWRRGDAGGSHQLRANFAPSQTLAYE
jgi:hypothetical protein